MDRKKPGVRMAMEGIRNQRNRKQATRQESSGMGFRVCVSLFFFLTQLSNTYFRSSQTGILYPLPPTSSSATHIHSSFQDHRQHLHIPLLTHFKMVRITSALIAVFASSLSLVAAQNYQDFTLDATVVPQFADRAVGFVTIDGGVADGKAACDELDSCLGVICGECNPFATD